MCREKPGAAQSETESRQDPAGFEHAQGNIRSTKVPVFFFTSWLDLSSIAEGVADTLSGVFLFGE